MLYTSLSCENLASEFDIRGLPVPILHPLPQDPRRVVYKPKKSKGIFKRKKNKEQPGGFYDREIAAASGEWVNEFIPNNGKKKTSSKLYVPSTAELLKRNIKRSWTISNPSGTGGPQLTPRNGDLSHPPHPAHPAHPFPPKQDLPVIDESRIASNRPVIIAQIPPPQHRGRAPHPGPHPGPHHGPHPGPPSQQVKRAGPVRSQSMGVADTARFYMKPGQVPVGSSGPPPRFRPPPPPEERRPVMSRRVEYAETSSDGEEGMFEPIIPDYRSLDRRKPNYAAPAGLQQKYKTLEPRSRSGGAEAHSLERLNSSRRVLPDVPSHSLPRQGKRTQSDSRTRERLEEGGKSLSPAQRFSATQVTKAGGQWLHFLHRVGGSGV